MQKSALLKQSDVDVASVAKLQYETAYTIWGFLLQLLKQLRGQPLVLQCFLGFDLITCQYPFHTTLQAWAVNCDRTSIRECLPLRLLLLLFLLIGFGFSGVMFNTA